MNDQSVKADAGKLPLTLVPLEIIEDIAEVRRYGNEKYKSSENWKKVEIERYRDAAFRHFIAYLRDPQGVDEESGLEHYKHWFCNCAFLAYMERQRKNDSKAEQVSAGVEGSSQGRKPSGDCRPRSGRKLVQLVRYLAISRKGSH